MATEDLNPNPTDDETQVDPQAETAADDAQDDEKPPEKTPAELQAEAETLRRQLKEANRKAAADRHRLAEIDRERQEKEDSKLSETAKLKKQVEAERESKRELQQENEKLKAEAFNTRLDREIERAAKGLFADPELAPKLVDKNLIDHDPETGKFARIKDAIERVLKDHPGLANAQRGGGSPAAMRTKRPGQGDGQGGNQLPPLMQDFLASGNYEAL
jgi:membrane protein involved in colicin uptake